MFDLETTEECPACGRPAAWTGGVQLTPSGYEFDFACRACSNRFNLFNKNNSDEWSRFGSYRTLDLIWQKTADPHWPYECVALGEIHLRLRLNEFPLAVLYTFFADNVCLGHFDDWPKGWQR